MRSKRTTTTGVIVLMVIVIPPAALVWYVMWQWAGVMAVAGVAALVILGAGPQPDAVPLPMSNQGRPRSWRLRKDRATLGVQVDSRR